jgi:hypothetical protein
MDMWSYPQQFDKEKKAAKPSFLRRLLRHLVTMLSAPRGYQGGWEGGSRGL